MNIDAYQQHLRDIDIPAWEYRSSNGADWFTIQLFSLMAKADPQNFKKLALVFPQEATAWQWWFYGKPETEEEFDAAINKLEADVVGFIHKTEEEAY